MRADAGQTRLTIAAHLNGPVIEGTLIEPSGDQREFHGWLALATAIEAALLRTQPSDEEQ